jgi:predicted Zn-dependent protease
MTTAKQQNRARAKRLAASASVLCLFCFACAVQPQIPGVADDRVESMLRSEAARIVNVSEDRQDFSAFHFLLSDFPRSDVLGMSAGRRRVYISYRLALLAMTDSNHRWLLRQTLAHEIGHETAAHAEQEGLARFNRRESAGVSARDIGLPWYVTVHNYSPEQELEADSKGLGYWGKLGWDCRIWVRILEEFQNQDYTGGFSHPTDRRLKQAQNACDAQRHQNVSDQADQAHHHEEYLLLN